MKNNEFENFFCTEKHPQFSTDFFEDAEKYEVWDEIDFMDLKEVKGENVFEIKNEDVIFFAEASLEDHPMMTDEHYAKNSEYGEIFISPLFITSIIFWCVGTKGKGNWIRTPGALNPGQSCVFHEHMRVGETIHIKMKPHDRFIKRGNHYLQYKVDLYNQNDVLKSETISTLILPKDRESIRNFIIGERGLDA